MSRCPWTSRTARPPRSPQATSTWTTSCSPAQHTPLRAISEEGFRAPAEATDEDLARMRQGGGNRFGEDDLAGPRGRRADEQRTGPALHHGPSAQRGRRSAGSSGPRGRRSSRARSGAGLPLPAPPGRSRVRPPKCVAPPRAAAAATAADHRPTRRRWLRRRERSPSQLRAWAGPSGTWGAWQKEQQPSHPRRERLLERWLPRRELAQRQRQGWPWDSQAAQPTAWPAARAGCWRTRSSGLSRAARTRPCRTSGNMNDATQPQHFTLRSGSSTSGSPASRRLLAVWLQSPGADQSHAALLLGPEPCDSAPVPAELAGKLRSSGRQSRLPPPSYDQLARDIEAA